MASTPDVSDPPDHPSSSVGSTIYSGSDGFDTPCRSRRERCESRQSTPGPLTVNLMASHDLDYDYDVRREYRSLEALRAANNSANYGNAVSHPFPHDSSLNQGSSASNNGDGEEMTDEDFFAQFGEEVPEWVKQAPAGEPQVQDNGFPDLLDEDLEAQLDSELGGAGANGPMHISEGDLEAQIDSELGAAAAGDNGPMDISEEDLLAQLDTELGAGTEDAPMDIRDQDLEAQITAELEAEPRQEEAAEAARRKANLQEDMRIAAEKAALAAPCSQRDDPPPPSEEALQAERYAVDPTDYFLGDVFDENEVISKLPTSVNRLTVKRYSYWRPFNRAKKAKTSPKARVPRSQPPPMRKADELPVMYHHGEIDWDLLRKHMSLSTRVDLNHCYRSLGLDVARGKAVYESLKEYLRIPGNSVDLSSKDVDSEDAKRIIADIAHKLLVNQSWGQTYFDRPSLGGDCKLITFVGNSTEVFLEFTSLVYKAMKLEEKRKKGKAKQQEETAANEVVQHPTSEAFATATYISPQAVANQTLPPAPRRQAAINGVVIAPRSVARRMPSQLQ